MSSLSDSLVQIMVQGSSIFKGFNLDFQNMILYPLSFPDPGLWKGPNMIFFDTLQSPCLYSVQKSIYQRLQVAFFDRAGALCQYKTEA